jgi:hypothetical protein
MNISAFPHHSTAFFFLADLGLFPDFGLAVLVVDLLLIKPPSLFS